QADVGGPKLDRSEIVRVTVWLDGEPLTAVDLDRQRAKPWIISVRARVRAGEHELRAALAAGASPADATAPAKRAAPPTLDGIRITGPFDPPAPAALESYQRIFTCTPTDQSQHAPCARQILTGLARRAYRRPVTAADVDPLLRLVAMAEREGESFAHGIRL